MDVVYRLRRGSQNEPLRLSLRSLRNLAHDRVWIVGHRLEWLRGVEHIACPQGANRWSNSAALLRAACSHREVSERFVLMDDDFFVTEPVGEVPVLHLGPMNENFGNSALMEYRKGMRRADELLRRWGIEEPLSYELHVPMAIEKQGMLDALEDEVPPGQARSMYGNLAGVGGARADDVKVHSHSAGIPDGPFVSTAPGSFTRSAKAGRAIRAMFPEPGPYEEAA